MLDGVSIHCQQHKRGACNMPELKVLLVPDCGNASLPTAVVLSEHASILCLFNWLGSCLLLSNASS